MLISTAAALTSSLTHEGEESFPLQGWLVFMMLDFLTTAILSA